MNERGLWLGVVVRALLDARLEAVCNQEEAMAREEARAWLSGAGRDYRLVCHLAGIDADWLRREYMNGRITLHVQGSSAKTGIDWLDGDDEEKESRAISAYLGLWNGNDRPAPRLAH